MREKESVIEEEGLRLCVCVEGFGPSLRFPFFPFSQPPLFILSLSLSLSPKGTVVFSAITKPQTENVGENFYITPHVGRLGTSMPLYCMVIYNTVTLFPDVNMRKAVIQLTHELCYLSFRFVCKSVCLYVCECMCVYMCVCVCV